MAGVGRCPQMFFLRQNLITIGSFLVAYGAQFTQVFLGYCSGPKTEWKCNKIGDFLFPGL